mgnify:CR=1 FL=1
MKMLLFGIVLSITTIVLGSVFLISFMEYRMKQHESNKKIKKERNDRI